MMKKALLYDAHTWRIPTQFVEMDAICKFLKISKRD